MKPNSREKWRVRWMWEKGQWRSALNPRCYIYRDCAECGRAVVMGFTTRRCNDCRHKEIDRRRRIAGPAHAKVKQAVDSGRLPKLDGSIPCADCGVPAVYYDHRSYAKPLEVDPVCVRCNNKRGPAIEFAQEATPCLT